MGLFVAEDRDYDGSIRQTGFRRYKQILSICFGQWLAINAITLLGFLPLAAGIFFAVQASSVLVLIPCSLAGGAVAGPFLSGLYDAILRGLRDDPWSAWKKYRRAWKQNWKGSLLPGAFMGLFIGIYTFMAMLFWWAEIPPSTGTFALYLFAILLMIVVKTLYWPQLVLFEQKASVRLRNCMLFCIKHFWCVMGVGVLQMVYWAVFVLFAPWTLILLPVLGLWYIVFLSQFLIYKRMDEAFDIEKSFAASQEQNHDGSGASTELM